MATVTDDEWKCVLVAFEPIVFRNDHEMFTQGGCYVLAEVINERTGWPIYGLDEAWDGIPDTHVFVIMPDGNCLDVDGVCTQEEMLEQWGAFEINPFPVGYDFEAEDWNNGFDTDAVRARAEELAYELIEKATT